MSDYFFRTVVEGYDLPITPEEFLSRLEEEQDKILGEAEWMPGIIKLVHHLYKVKNILTICSCQTTTNNF